ncbi:MAG TPA: hypothetical protein VML75_27825 [Kofleriaceae bacterium]|nr:hypothetical protein [Kofleriaceae bacterium]
MKSALLSAVLALSACQGAVGTFSIELITAPGSDVMDDVVLARLTLTDPLTIAEADRVDGGFTFDIEVSAGGQNAFLLFEGFDAANQLIASGRTGPLPIAAFDDDLRLFVAAPRSLSEAPMSLDPPRSELGAARLSFGVLLAGGRNAAGEPTDDLVVYSLYDHQLRTGAPLPAPRANMTALTAALGQVLLFGGDDPAGQPSELLWRFDSNTAPAGSYLGLASNPELARSGARGAPISNTGFVVLGDPMVFIDNLSGRAQALPDAMPMNGTITSVVINDMVYTLIAGDEAGDIGAVLLVNGVFNTLTDAPVEIDRTGHGAVVLANGDILVVGGATAGGLETSGIRFAPATRVFTTFGDLLATPRNDAAIAATRELVIVAGGTDVNGDLVTDAEVFSADDLTRLATVPMVVPRTRASAEPMANGQVLIAGGIDATGAPVGTIELLTP